MGKHISPAALRESSAAAYLDMPVREFRNLVKVGALPGPVKLANNVERWITDDLNAILTGKAALPTEDFE